MPTAYYLCPLQPQHRNRDGTPTARAMMKNDQGEVVGLMVACTMFDAAAEIAADGGKWSFTHIPQEPTHPYGSTLAVVNGSAALLASLDAKFERLTRVEAGQRISATVQVPRYDAVDSTLKWDGRAIPTRSLVDLEGRTA